MEGVLAFVLFLYVVYVAFAFARYLTSAADCYNEVERDLREKL
ncbi:MAG: hypothetical protein AB7U75_14685 [Hyphomicrobiaceae bacterium]